MPCTSWPGLDESKRKTRSGKEEIIWLAKIRAGNRRNRAVWEWRKIRRPQSKPRRARSGWLTSVGTTAPRISSSPAGNGSPAGAAAPWFTRPSRFFCIVGGPLDREGFSREAKRHDRFRPFFHCFIPVAGFFGPAPCWSPAAAGGGSQDFDGGANARTIQKASAVRTAVH